MPTFDELRVKVGRKPITVVELELDTCTRSYGVAPCTAAIGVTGVAKCFNTFKTCQDQANYDRTTRVVKFTEETSFLPVGEEVFPAITGVDIAPTQLKPDSLAVSATATITLKDFPHHDRGQDPYWTERTPEGGTFFSRLRARSPYMVNRVVRVNSGYIDDDRVIVTMTRTYFVDRMEGPDSRGRVRLICKDALRFTDVEKAKAPAASRGSLSAGISNSDTTLTLTPSGIGSEYAATADPADSRWVIINDELISYTTRTGDVLSGLSRGQQGTTAASQAAGDAVQRVLVYNSKTVADVAYDLLVNYAGIDASYITKADWDNECATWLPGYTISGVYIPRADGVKKRLESLMQSSGSALWWDDESAKLRFKVLVPVVANSAVPTLTEEGNFLKDTLNVRDLEKDRISRVIVYHGVRDKTADPSKENSANITINLDATTEGPNAYTTEQSREIITAWMPNVPQATDLGDRLLRRYKETPREFTFRVDAKDATLKTGDLVDVSTRLNSNPDGSNNVTRCIVTEKREVESGSHYEYVALQVSQVPGSVAFLITPDAQADWTSATADEKAKYFFISNASGFMSDLSQAARLV